MTPEQKAIRDRMWNDETEVIEFLNGRHLVMFGDGEILDMTFCNNCGSCFIIDLPDAPCSGCLKPSRSSIG